MTFATIQYVEDFEDRLEDSCRFEKIGQDYDGRMPVASATASHRAAHRRKARRARNRVPHGWHRVEL